MAPIYSVGAMYDIKIEIGVRTDRQKVVVRDCDTDVGGLGDAGRQQLPRPTHMASMTSCIVVEALIAVTVDDRRSERSKAKPPPSSELGTDRGPATHRIGIWPAGACKSGREHGESSVTPTISISPDSASACLSLCIAAETRSTGRSIAGGQG
jgi:hypothetical protein